MRLVVWLLTFTVLLSISFLLRAPYARKETVSGFNDQQARLAQQISADPFDTCPNSSYPPSSTGI